MGEWKNGRAEGGWREGYMIEFFRLPILRSNQSFLKSLHLDMSTVHRADGLLGDRVPLCGWCVCMDQRVLGAWELTIGD